MVAVAVAVANEIEPMDRHSFTKLRPGEQVVHQAGHVGRFGRGETINCLGGGWQPDQVKVNPAREDVRRSWFGGLELSCLQLGQDEMVDGVPWPGAVEHAGDTRPLGRDVRPVLFELGPLGDPVVQLGFLFRGQRLAAVLRRHHVVMIRGVDTLVERTFFRGTRHEDFVCVKCVAEDIEPKVRLTLVAVKAVTGETVVREDRPNIPVKLDRLAAPGTRQIAQTQRQNDNSTQEIHLKKNKAPEIITRTFSNLAKRLAKRQTRAITRLGPPVPP